MSYFATLLQPLPAYRSILKAIREGRAPLGVTGLSPVHKAHFAASLCAEFDRPGLLIVPDEPTARRMTDDLVAMGVAARQYPARDITLRPSDSVSHEFEHLRLGVLGSVLSGACRMVVASCEAAAQYTLPPERLRSGAIPLSEGGKCSLQELAAELVACGYVRRPQIDGVCQFSVRGGIVDIYSPEAPQPIRLEFWGDDIDSISYFDLESQRRTERIEHILLTPAREALFEEAAALAAEIEDYAATIRTPLAKGNLLREAAALRENGELSNLDKYLPMLFAPPATLFDYFSLPNTPALLFVSDTAGVREAMRDQQSLRNEDYKILFEEGILCKGLDNYSIDYAEMTQIFEEMGALYFETFVRAASDLRMKELFAVNCFSVSGFSGELTPLLEDVTDVRERGDCCLVLAGTPRAAAALADDLRNADIPVLTTLADAPVKGQVYVLEGGLSSGFEYPEIGLTVLTHAGTFHKARRHKAKKKRAGEAIRSLSDLTVGDYVVHATHGIGVFDGIHKMEIQGVTKDYIKIKYAGADVLYIPVTMLDLVSKYIGPREDTTLKLSRLNSGEWNKTKTRVRAAVADMAKELLKIYAERGAAKGFSFSEDSDWQRDFEERFPYEETDDQLRCVEEIKHDMESERPMDRLLCGDVGFGKTEVALRAAFKCLMDSKQCAILVPTTILAWQHYQTMLRRFEGFPIQVELLSRFRTPKQQKEIVKKLADGRVDIVVGTHRLVQKDIQFKDLGLVIVDEEQRFGVAHKEKFKEMFSAVDVLTLSATPIPRTLNMAMSGIRDISTIEEAPQNRHPIQTYVMEHDLAVLAEAIRKELRRGGQVYYIHNRIDSIEQTAVVLGELVPDAHIETAHGRMTEEQLSGVWKRLLDGDIDVLVCTTIIETGVDVSNVNTLIIEDADYMGLSQLYQLRGRVGRSSRRASAYLTFRRGKAVSEIAQKRLTAIREFTKFGSGFNIAMRDLEIRGAGNILGAQQHGHMQAVGYEMYLRLLSDEVARLQGKITRPNVECQIDIPISAHIPEEYIEDLPQRLDVYKRIASVTTEEDCSDVIDELIDRFGEPPRTVLGLLDVALLRNTAAGMGITDITQRGDALMFFPAELDMELAGAVAAAHPGKVMVNAGKKPYISFKLGRGQGSLDGIRLGLTALQLQQEKLQQKRKAEEEKE